MTAQEPAPNPAPQRDFGPGGIQRTAGFALAAALVLGALAGVFVLGLPQLAPQRA